MDILESGIYHDLSNEAYHQQPAISKSVMKNFEGAASPAHFYAKAEPFTKVINMGTIVHLAILEPHLYEETVVKVPADVLGKNGAKNTKAYREWQAEQDKTGKLTVTEEEAKKVDNCLTELHENPRNSEARDLLLTGAREVSFFWQNVQTFDYPAKCRPDNLPGNRIVVDLKTTGALAEPIEFGRIAAKLKYHWSSAWTLNGVSELTGQEHDDYRFVVIEQEPPHGIIVYRATIEQLKLAWMQINQFLPDMIDCIESNVYPGYPDGTHDLPLPYWEMKQMEGLMNEGGPIYD